jgi:hypothetical protein
MEPGTEQLITLKAKNTGTFTWDKFGPAPVRLGTWQPNRPSKIHNNWLSDVRVVDMNESTIAPGEVAGFQFRVKAPSVPGPYYERFNLVAEGQRWFNDPGLTLYIKSGGQAWKPVWSSISTGSTTVNRGQEFTITVRAKNIGDLTWKRTAGYPSIRVGTASPLNRGSNLYNPTWINDIRPGGLIESNVPPGSEGTFTFKATAPDWFTGPIAESFNLVAEGQQWFASPPITFNLTLK